MVPPHERLRPDAESPSRGQQDGTSPCASFPPPLSADWLCFGLAPGVIALLVRSRGSGASWCTGPHPRRPHAGQWLTQLKAPQALLPQVSGRRWAGPITSRTAAPIASTCTRERVPRVRERLQALARRWAPVNGAVSGRSSPGGYTHSWRPSRVQPKAKAATPPARGRLRQQFSCSRPAYGTSGATGCGPRLPRPVHVTMARSSAIDPASAPPMAHPLHPSSQAPNSSPESVVKMVTSTT